MSNAKETETHIVGFDQFVDYFLKTWELNPNPKYYLGKTASANKNIDYHWHSQLYNCFPCHVEYDYVTKTETAHRDSKIIFTEIFNRTDFFLPEAYEAHISGVSAANQWLDEEQIEGLREKFRWELEMFGYEY